MTGCGGMTNNLQTVYIYISVPSNRIKDILNKYVHQGILEIIEWQGSAAEAYEDCIRHHREDVAWLALLDVQSFLAPVPIKFTLAQLLRLTQEQMSQMAVIHLGGTTAALVRPAAVQGVSASGHILPDAGWEVADDEGTYFTLLPRKEAMARLDPAWRPWRIALTTHVLVRNGAPLALLAAAECLQKQGYEIHVYAYRDGLLKQDFEARGIPVTVQDDLLGHAWTDLPWYADYDLIVANTVLFAPCFCKPLDKTPVLWWLHEGASSLRWIGLTKENIKRMLVSSPKVMTVGVSGLANHAFHSLAPNWKIDGTLPLGTEDFCGRRGNRDKEKGAPMIFLIVGALEPRKGQDVLCRAVQLLTPEERRACEFHLIGTWSVAAPEEWKGTVRQMIARCPAIKALGRIPHEDVLQKYQEADAVIVPSNEETLSMAAMEGMAASCACILSDGVGVAKFAEPGKSALIFPAGDASALAKQLRRLIHHPKKIDAIGKAGREIYEAFFQPQNFEERLLYLVGECMEKK